jgi:hypothetical protein
MNVRCLKVQMFGLSFLGAAALPLAGCGFLVVHTARHVYSEATKDERLVEAALKNYQQIVVSGKYGHIGDAFDATAELSHDNAAPIVGREAIDAFFKSFAGYDVREYELKAASTVVDGNAATQSGTYRQVVSPPGGDSQTVTGQFSIEWTHPPGGAWLIHKLRTTTATAVKGA